MAEESPHVSNKMRRADHDRAGEIADEFVSTRLETFTAWRIAFDRLPEKRQRDSFTEARRLFPMPYPRTGRGNRALRKRAASSAA